MVSKDLFCYAQHCLMFSTSVLNVTGTPVCFSNSAFDLPTCLAAVSAAAAVLVATSLPIVDRGLQVY